VQAALPLELFGGVEVGAPARDVRGQDDLACVDGLMHHVRALLVPVDADFPRLRARHLGVGLHSFGQLLQLSNGLADYKDRPLALDGVEYLQDHQFQPAVVPDHDILLHGHSLGLVGRECPELHLVYLGQHLLLGLGSQSPRHAEYAIAVECNIAHVGDKRSGKGLRAQPQVMLELHELVEPVAPHRVVEGHARVQIVHGGHPHLPIFLLQHVLFVLVVDVLRCCGAGKPPPNHAPGERPDVDRDQSVVLYVFLNGGCYKEFDSICRLGLELPAIELVLLLFFLRRQR
jgi:hypothetical protein